MFELLVNIHEGKSIDLSPTELERLAPFTEYLLGIKKYAIAEKVYAHAVREKNRTGMPHGIEISDPQKVMDFADYLYDVGKPELANGIMRMNSSLMWRDIVAEDNDKYFNEVLTRFEKRERIEDLKDFLADSGFFLFRAACEGLRTNCLNTMLS
ncbi:MAG: hypothetical protein PHE27_08600, partial [Alphaproteobacteria bacterium]|nr:hypothetical protein [Alphaproteobacteria bacterium]